MKGRIEGNDVIISKGDFEHLLNCLANQKWLPAPEKQAGIELECQGYIDKCWIEGMELLNSKPTITSEAQKFFEDFAKEIELQPRPSFKQALSTLINQYSKENGSDTPDFILAKFLTDSLKAFNKATNRREEWYEDDKLPECKSFGPWNISVEEQLCEKLSEDIISQMNQVKMKDNKYHSGTVTTSSYPYNVEFIISYEPK